MSAIVALTALPVRAAAAPAARRNAAVRSSFAGSRVRVQPRLRTNASRAMAARAEKGSVDFDGLLAKGAEAWENAPNKPVVVGYGVAGVAFIYVAETVVHWPLFNIILGFPLELLGITTAGYLALRYLKDGEDPANDLSALGKTLSDTLPGLKE